MYYISRSASGEELVALFVSLVAFENTRISNIRSRILILKIEDKNRRQ